MQQLEFVLLRYIIDGDQYEIGVCCVACARKAAVEAASVTWWEVFDQQGNMIDSADKLNEELYDD